MNFDEVTSQIDEIFLKLTNDVRNGVNDCEQSFERNQTSELTLNVLIQMLDNLSHVVQLKTRMSPKEERKQEANLISAIMNTSKLQLKVKILKTIFNDIHPKLNASVVKLNEQIKEEKMLMQRLKEQEQFLVSMKNKDAQDFIAKIEKETCAVEEKLRKKFEKIKETDLKASRNLIIEDDLYLQRKQAEDEHVKMLKMYDENVGKYYREMKLLEGDLATVKLKLQTLEGKLAVQDVEYKKLEAEYNAKIEQAFIEALEGFKKNRAAKIIQQAWKIYMEKTILRKKKSRRKKHK